MKDTPSPHWRKSSHSGHSGGDCIEVADLNSVVGVRDSKDPNGPEPTMTRNDFRRLAEMLKEL